MCCCTLLVFACRTFCCFVYVFLPFCLMLCAYVAPLLFIVAVAVRCLWGAVRSLETATSLPLLRRGRLRRMLPLQVRSDGKQREGEGQRQTGRGRDKLREKEGGRRLESERETDNVIQRKDERPTQTGMHANLQKRQRQPWIVPGLRVSPARQPRL